MPNGTDAQGAALSLYQLLGAPLYALIEAETYAAEATADFIERVGFEATGSPPDGPANRDIGRMRTLSFRQERRDAAGQAASYRVDVPLLSILPIPAMQIKEAELEFFVKIVDMVQSRRRRQVGAKEAPPDTETDKEETAGLVPIADSNRIDFKSMMGHGQLGGDGSSRTGLDMQVHIRIKVEQADVPAGLSRLFNLMEQSISSTPLQEESEPNDG